MSESTDKVVEWAKAHKAWFGWAASFIAAGLEGTGHSQAAAIVGMVATALIGAGHVKSDSYYKQP